jgi:hypothetical protein
MNFGPEWLKKLGAKLEGMFARVKPKAPGRGSKPTPETPQGSQEIRPPPSSSRPEPSGEPSQTPPEPPAYKSEPIGAPSENATAIAIELRGRYPGVRAALPELNNKSLTQMQMVDMLNALFAYEDKTIAGAVMQPDGTVVLLSARLGLRQPIIGVSPSGQARFGSATIFYDPDAGALSAIDIDLP